MARIRISIAIAFLSLAFVGAWVLAAVHFAPFGSVSGAHPALPGTGSASRAAVTAPAEPHPSGREITADPGGVPARTPGRTVERPRVASPTPVAPRFFTGLHIAFPRVWRPVTYEVHGPQKPPVRLVCPCPPDSATQPSAGQSTQSGQAPANGATSDARVTLMEWSP